MMYNDYVREITEEEMAIYNKVEEAFEDEEIEEFFNSIAEEEIEDLLKNKIRNTNTKATIKTKGLTISEVCTWYFIG